MCFSNWKNQNITFCYLVITKLIANFLCCTGGLKIWECTQDLANYILKQGMKFHSKRVLDLGCGSGILGILAMQLGAATVHFQDYVIILIKMQKLPIVARHFICYNEFISPFLMSLV